MELTVIGQSLPQHACGPLNRCIIGQAAAGQHSDMRQIYVFEDTDDEEEASTLEME